MSIRVLPPGVAATIAAGEVIERPASAAKELLENAIDAGATTVRIEIQRGGLDLIRVVDDGCGIAAGELETAFQRHATSKLRAAADLASLATLGFRGEALPSLIAACAELHCSSRAEGEPAGCRVVFRDGSLVERGPAAQARGTGVALRGLFANQPARFKFLRSPAAEAAQLAAVVNPYALAYPRLRLALSVDGRQVLHTTGSGDLREAATRVLGSEVGGQLLSIETAGDWSNTGIRVHGLVSPPALTRATRGGIMLFVNRRWVQPRRLAFAVEQAYDTLLTVGRHPIAVLFLDLPPADVDVNVHPTKAEVRFRDERAVFGAVHAAVRRTLLQAAPVPEFGPNGQSPELLSRTDGDDQLGPVILDGAQPAQAPLWQTLLRPEDHTAHRHEEAIPVDAPRLPLLRVVGQTGSTYIVAEGPTGMYLIDQHAAHERVLYEQVCRERAAAAIDRQGLLAPVSVELSPVQAAAFAGYAELLAAAGFEFEPFGERALLLRALPALLGDADPARALTRLLDALEEGHEPASDDRLLKTLACHGSVRAGKLLSLEEMRALVLQLEGCEAPRTCPHGRPTMVHLSAATLEREFKRR